MPLLLNGNNLENVLFNGNQLEVVQLNGNTVWTRGTPSIEWPSGYVVFDSVKNGVSVDGTTQITIEDEGAYNVTIVGAGGGGAAWLYRWGGYPNNWRSSVAAGGAGGYFYQQILLTQGVYTVEVGKGGDGHSYILNNNASSKPSYPGIVTASNGGNSSLSGLAGSWISYGGTGGSCGNGTATGGSGGYGQTSNGGKGGSAFANYGTTRTIEKGGNYIDTWSNGGSNASDYGQGGGSDSEYYASGPSWLVRGKSGVNGYVKIVKA